MFVIYEQDKNTNNMKDVILHKALNELKVRTGFKIAWGKNVREKRIDGVLTCFVNDTEYKWQVQVKTAITPNYLVQFTNNDADHTVKKKYPLVITEYVYPKLREQLKNNNIAYLDTVGNIFLQQGPIFIFIDGNPKPADRDKQKNRVFTKAGLQVLYYLLCDKKNINKTYREIAETTGTALDTVHKTINGLKLMKYTIQINEKTYKLIHIKELLEKWIYEYELKLKPKLLIDTFRFANKQEFHKWNNLQLKPGTTFWGGEAAGAILTDYLNPEILTIYTTELRNELIKNYQLIPDPNGNVIAYKMFWNDDEVRNDKTVNPLLAYANLINVGDKRCVETANIIYDKYLRNRFQ